MSRQSSLYKNAISFCYKLLSELPDAAKDTELYKTLEKEIYEYAKDISVLLVRYLEPKNEKYHPILEARTEEMCVALETYIDLFEREKMLTEKESAVLIKEIQEFCADQKQLILKRKKVVILTTTFGYGHNAAAHALKNAMLEMYGYDVEIAVVDLLKGSNSLYETSVKYTPGVYRWLFESTDTDMAMDVMNSIVQPVLGARLENLVREEDPDIIVSTYPLLGAQQWIADKLRKSPKYIPLVLVVTDSISVHQMWITEDIDYYIVPNEDTKEIMVEKGVKAECVKVLGFPVNTKFYADYDIKKEREKEGIDPDKLTFLALVNTGGTQKDVEFLYNFEEVCGGKAQCMMILGKNEQLYKKLLKKNLGPNVKLYTWVGDMYRLMNIADVMIAKAGGAITMECIAVKKPMIITKVLPGQEEGNAETVLKYGLGDVIKDGDPEEVLAVMKSYTDHPKLVEDVKKNFDGITIPRATFKVAEFVKGLMK
ncbi:MAG: MGDG synthase family glycosyltransferase [Candidatus Gracilibacteria bacterium]